MWSDMPCRVPAVPRRARLRAARVVGAALALLVGGPALAQAPPPLEDLVAEAVRDNPELKAAEASLAAARERPDQARSLPDPMLTLGYRNDGWAFSLGEQRMTGLQVMLSQELPAWGERGLRARVAALGADRVEQALARARLDLEAAVKSAWFGLREARSRLELLNDEETLWRRIEGVTRARYAVGQGAQQDVIRVQVEITRIEQRRALLAADERVRLTELNALLGRPAGTGLDTPPGLELRPLAEPLEASLAATRERSPELEAARLAIESAGLGVALAETARKPGLRLSAGYVHRGRLDPMWEASVGIDLPLRRRRLAAGVAEAEAARRAAEQALAGLELRLSARTEERHARLMASERVVEVYERGVIPQDGMSVEAALASYRSGGIPFAAVLEALATLYEDRGALLGTLLSHEQLRAGLEAASLEPAPRTAGGAPPVEGGMR